MSEPTGEHILTDEGGAEHFCRSTNSPKTSCERTASCRADVGIGPYAEYELLPGRATEGHPYAINELPQKGRFVNLPYKMA